MQHHIGLSRFYRTDVGKTLVENTCKLFKLPLKPVKHQRIVTLAAVNDITAVTAIANDAIVSGITKDRVVATITVNRVIARIAINSFGDGCANKDVVSIGAAHFAHFMVVED
jgi:hypothetical protein